MTAIDTSFGYAFEELRAQRAEMRADRDELRLETRAGFSEVRARFAEVRADISALQRQMTQIVAGLAIALLGVVAAGIFAAL